MPALPDMISWQRRPEPRDGAEPDVPRRIVVCGDGRLAYRLIDDLITRYRVEVVAVVPSRRQGHGPRIARLAGVRVIEAQRLDTYAFRQARLADVDALALVDQDDVGNIHAALQAQEVNPRIRLVLRMFNMSLGHAIRGLFTDCAVLSDSAMSAPEFVSAALGEVAPAYVRLRGQTVFVARPDRVLPAQVLCGLTGPAPAAEAPESVEPADGELLPADLASAALVLAMANGVPDGPVVGYSAAGAAVTPGSVVPPMTDAYPEDPPPRRVRRWRQSGRRAMAMLRMLVDRKLRVAALILLLLLVPGSLGLALARDISWWDAVYLTVLTEFGGAEADLTAGTAEKILQTLLTIGSVALIPVLTAAIVEAVVNARLALPFGRTRVPISGHIVVVGLGNVGTRVIRQLHDLGVPVVAIDRSESARGAALARSLGIHLIIGDASREETLRSASVATCRALVCLSSDDVTNLESALLGRGIAENLRVVLRLFDGEFADRVGRAFGITASRSVSDLAAPAFAAALVDPDVVGTIPLGRRVLLIAEVCVQAGSQLDGATVQRTGEITEARLIGLVTDRGRQILWAPPPMYVLCADDVLLVAATRVGLAGFLTASGSAR